MSSAPLLVRSIPSAEEQPLGNARTVAEWLGQPTAAVYRWVHDGTLDTVRVGRKILIKTTSVRRLAGLD